MKVVLEPFTLLFTFALEPGAPVRTFARILGAPELANWAAKSAAGAAVAVGWHTASAKAQVAIRGSVLVFMVFWFMLRVWEIVPSSPFLSRFLTRRFKKS